MLGINKSCFSLLLLINIGFISVIYVTTNYGEWSGTSLVIYSVGKTGTPPHNEVSDTRIQRQKKVIYSATFSWYPYDGLTFEHCEYSNCISRSVHVGNILEADIVILEAGMIFKPEYVPDLPQEIRERQFWLLSTPESQAGPYWRWKSNIVDNRFNGTMTFRHDSTIPWQWGYYEALHKNITESHSDDFNYLQGKSRGAFAYVSNCNSHNYDRLKVMQKLQKYIQVDIFGKCTNKQPCPRRMDYECEKEIHSKYKFFLAFENSLCEDYITEKFWARLASPSYYVPLAVGGTSLEDYIRIAPPDSFLHAYNFSSIDDLGSYLQYLDHNDSAYIRYHKWRSQYTISFPNHNVTACQLCYLANNMPNYQAEPQLASWWNNKSLCLQNGIISNKNHWTIGKLNKSRK